MERITFEGLFCDIAQCVGQPGNTSECPGGYCDQRRTWEQLKQYEDTGVEPEKLQAAITTIRLRYANSKGLIKSIYGELLELLNMEEEPTVPEKDELLAYATQIKEHCEKHFFYKNEDSLCHCVFVKEGEPCPFGNTAPADWEV